MAQMVIFFRYLRDVQANRKLLKDWKRLDAQTARGLNLSEIRYGHKQDGDLEPHILGIIIPIEQFFRGVETTNQQKTGLSPLDTLL